MENLGNDRILVIRVEAEDRNFYVVAVYLPSSNQSIKMYWSCLDVLEDASNQLDDADSLFVLGDFNAHIGNYGGPRSLPNVNERGWLLISFMERMSLRTASCFVKDQLKHFMHRKVRLQVVEFKEFLEKKIKEYSLRVLKLRLMIHYKIPILYGKLLKFVNVYRMVKRVD